MSLIEAQKGLTNLRPCNASCGGDMDHYTWTQNETEVVIRVPLPSGTTSKSVSVTMEPSKLKVAFKTDLANPVLQGPLFKPIKAEDSMWCVEDKTLLVITLFKTNREYEEWWPHVCTTEPQVDMKTLTPPEKHMRELDDGARATVEKLMFDQNQKRMGLPTSDEQKMQDMMRQMKLQEAAPA
jgi:hypothetical protein